MRLADGDIIQGINNKQVKTADDMVEFYNMLKSGSNINLKIKRQGKQESLNYVFQ
jgi:type II secretory pathway component PulC